MGVEIHWSGNILKQRVTQASSAGVRAAALYYQTACRRAVSIPNTGKRVKVKKRSKGGNKRSRTIYPNPSQPGESPRLRTGFGQRNVLFEWNKATGVARVGVGANAMYMFYLEVGTRRVARRPWMIRTLTKNMGILGQLASAYGRKKM